MSKVMLLFPLDTNFLFLGSFATLNLLWVHFHTRQTNILEYLTHVITGTHSKNVPMMQIMNVPGL